MKLLVLHVKKISLKEKFKSVLLFDLAPSGHREGHLQLYRTILGAEVCQVSFGFSWKNWMQLLGSEEVLLSSADHYAVPTFLISLIRRCLGRETVGVLIAAENLVFEKGPRQGCRGGLLQVAKKLWGLKALSITPFDLAPHNRKLCVDWIFDPQVAAKNLISVKASQGEEEFAAVLKKRRGEDRVVLSMLGWLSRADSLSLARLLELISKVEQSKAGTLTFMLAGGASDSDLQTLANFESDETLMWTKRISEEAFGQLVDLSDLIWCYFPDSYNQNSGVFWNAVVSGKKIIARKESFLHRLGAEHLELEEEAERGNLSEMGDDLVVLRCSKKTSRVIRMAHERLETKIKNCFPLVRERMTVEERQTRVMSAGR